MESMELCVKLVVFLTAVPAVFAAKSQLDCDFETSCHYKQDKTDAHDWQLNSGKTQTARTGPDYDHTLGNSKGHYIYMESSGGNTGHIFNARLISPIFRGDNGQCLSFYYNMYGAGIGALNVYLNHINPANGGTTFSSQVWHKGGAQSVNESDWKHALIPLISGHGARLTVVIEAVKGTSYLSDIAIDDILLLDNCSTDPATPPPPTTTPGPMTSNVPGLTATGDVHILANPSSMHTQFTKNLMVNCTYHHGNGSDFSTLVSLLLSKKNSTYDTSYTELATITAFSNDQLEVKNDIGAQVSAHLVATGESYITLQWLYPSDLALGDYKCEGFGLDHSGHPRVSSSTTKISQLLLNCETVLPKYKDTDLKLDAVNSKLDKFVGKLLQHSGHHGNHSYFLSRPVARDVELGASLCDVTGGYLVEVNERSEFEFLVNLTGTYLKDNQTTAIVLGATNEGHPQKWSFLGSGEVMTYFDWEDGEDKGPGTNCLFVGQSGKMFNSVCQDNSMVRLVCEYNQ